MTWLASIGVGLLSGLVGCVVAFLLCLLAIEWYQIPQREGAAAFMAVAVALLVFILSLILGIICARHSAAAPEPSFLHAWGRACAFIAAPGLAALILMWLFADFPPKWDGRRLELVVELRTPPGFAMPPLDPSDAYVAIIRMPSGESKGWSQLQLDRTRVDEGRLIVPAMVSLETSAHQKLLSARLGKGYEALFPLNFGSKPGEKEKAWSEWLQATDPADPARPAREIVFEMRYRVQQEPPPAPVPTREEVENEAQAKLDAEYRALTPSTPLSAWLRFTRYGIPEERQRAAAAAIRARPGFEQEMTEAILGSDLELTRETLRAFPYFGEPLLELAPLVRQKGDNIAVALRARSESAPDDPARSAAGADISLDFSAWMEAVRSLQGQAGTTFVPQLEQIAHLSRAKPIDHVIAIDVLRVASYYLHTWAGTQPLPEDPPPR
jgi:hypothetical protein